MAYTSIWSVKGWLGKVVVYTQNPAKTKNPEYFEKQGMTPDMAQNLSDVIDYASQDKKVQLIKENTEILRYYVTGVNCNPATARDEMLAVKKKFGKDDGVIAYHGIQSFSKEDLRASAGKLTSDMAHEIGVKLAQRLWGDSYQVLVSTHLDKENHLHSHFVVNTVSWTNGIRYHRTKTDYFKMQNESDNLCREYGLSVISEPQTGKSKHYGEWKAEHDRKPTYRNLLKTDIDTAILESMTEYQFWDNLYKKGYQVKIGKDITLRPQGKDRGLKLYRNFGDDYTLESIRNRILSNTRPQRQIIPPGKPVKRIHVKRNKSQKKITGLRALYFYYLHKIGVYPRKKYQSPQNVYFLFREDIRFVQTISKETRLLVKNKIDTTEQLSIYKTELSNEIQNLSGTRKQLQYQSRKMTDTNQLTTVKSEITRLSERIGILRKEVVLCEGIETRSVDMKDKLHKEHEDTKNKRKESRKYESFRRRR